MRFISILAASLFFIKGHAQNVVSSSASVVIGSGNGGSGQEASSSSQITDQLPNGVQKYTHVLYGEDGQECQGTIARVDYQDGVSNQQEEVVEEAVANAVISNYNDEDEFQAAQQSAVAILEVIAQAQGSVNIEVVSSNAGCWGIGYGRAYASAVASGTATAISQAISQATGTGAQVELEAITKDVARNVSQVVESVAALLALGDGTSMSVDRSVVAEAKVKVMVCALARAYAVAKTGEAKGAAVAFTGCDKITPTSFPKNVGAQLQCQCKTFGSQPKGCGIHGINQNDPKDYICYVKNPNCFCAQRSKLYAGQSWRYCGESLKQMQKYLNIDNQDNGISPPLQTNGFCGSLDADKDFTI
eukprot:TRINITY_DN5678_c0_g2_i1.p1 TRINITY_DN5678_c0_g2~~TRINITY_DN5678_c0_g2_i1.p1  ORF type:complete len:360 (-),score=79.02 TRINITY_DN5678_c0_g2_i1:73-1152(-)